MCDKCGKYEPTTPDEIHVADAPRHLIIYALKENPFYKAGRKSITQNIHKNLERETQN